MSLIDFMSPCPFCYTQIDLRKVDFRCLGRPAPGCTPCAKGVDKARSREFHDVREYYPAFTVPRQGGLSVPRRAECPHCHEDTGVRLCPHCHSRLPDGFSAHSPLFGLVGARSSGKTVILAVMTQELGVNGPVQRRFGHAISPSETGDANSQATVLGKLLDQMKTSGSLPPQTQRTTKALPVVFEWKKPGSRLGKIHGEEFVPTVFSFYDTAGEDLATTDRALSVTYLLATDGVILVLDPFSFPGNADRQRAATHQKVETSPENVLTAVTETLRQGERTKPGKKIKQPVAVVISKIDAFFDDLPQTDPIRNPSSTLPYFDDEESKTVHDHIASLIASWSGDGLLRQLEMGYRNYRLFGLSALGAEPDYAKQRVDRRGILPHRVSEPLLWLMAERGFLSKKA